MGGCAVNGRGSSAGCSRSPLTQPTSPAHPPTHRLPSCCCNTPPPCQGVYSSWVAQICINFLTFWILLSYLVPISLFVTMEIVKFWQVGRGGR